MPRQNLFLLASAIIMLALALPNPSHATPYWGTEEVARFLDSPNEGHLPPFLDPPDGDRTDPTYAEVLARIASFQSIWQVNNPQSPDHGGIREGEHLPNIIQTDNTSEAIWVWTRYYELTGDNTYLPNIMRAFQYSLSHPAYLEEGGATQTTGYYRMYNCGWAVRAEQKYRDLYGDLTYKAYSDSSASYIRYHTLVRFGNTFYDYVNPPVLAWALGNLYAAGVHESNQAWKDRAVQEAQDKVKSWVEGEPGLLGNETWAMSGGATMWGLLNSYFLAHPDEVAVWVPYYKGWMDAASSPGDFENAWNGWYALGHRAAGVVLRDPYELALHITRTDAMIDEDGDGDGGVPAKPADTDDMDQTWVSNYLAFMGVSDILGANSAVDGGPLASNRALTLLAGGPNPSHGTCTFTLDIAPAATLVASVHDLTGRKVADLASGFTTAGPVTMRWDGMSIGGAEAPTGVYFVRFLTAGMSVQHRIVLIR